MEARRIFGWLLKYEKFQLSALSISLSLNENPLHIYIYEMMFIPHKTMNVRVKRASASPSLPRCPSILIIIVFLWLFLLCQESTARNATLDPSEAIAFFFFSFFSPPLWRHALCIEKWWLVFLGLWILLLTVVFFTTLIIVFENNFKK